MAPFILIRGGYLSGDLVTFAACLRANGGQQPSPDLHFWTLGLQNGRKTRDGRTIENYFRRHS